VIRESRFAIRSRPSFILALFGLANLYRVRDRSLSPQDRCARDRQNRQENPARTGARGILAATASPFRPIRITSCDGGVSRLRKFRASSAEP